MNFPGSTRVRQVLTASRARRRLSLLVATAAVAALLMALLRPGGAVAAYPYAAPGDLTITAVTKSSMTVSWKAVSGAPGYEVRFYAEGKTTKYKETTSASVAMTGLSSGTKYYVRAKVKNNATDETLSANSPESEITTSTYTLASPDAVKVTSRDESSTTLSWKAGATLPSGGGYKIIVAEDAALKTNPKTVSTGSATSGTVSGLKSNWAYYGAAYAVNADGGRISGNSTYVQIKTEVPRGTLTGRVSGANSGDLIATAYNSSGEAAEETSVSDGRYSMAVRPGSYAVKLSYLGTGNFTSPWVKTGASNGTTTRSTATTYSVKLDQTTNVADTDVDPGGVVEGVVRIEGRSEKVRDVDVTALSAMTDEREVEAMAATNNDGYYKIQGLADGDHWLRFVYSGDGFKTRSIKVTVTNGNAATKDAELETADFRKTYGVSISGTKSVGRTLTATATRWLAGSYPTTYATMSYQWKRNGAAITGATKSTYTLTSADRGKTISVTATASRYGYTTGSVTSTGYRIS